MDPLPLLETHRALGAVWGVLHERQCVDHYGDPAAERALLRGGVGLMDLSFRSRLCLLGRDRQPFLNGQITQNVKMLRPGMGGYGVFLSPKGKIQGDACLHVLENEILLDAEPGAGAALAARFERFIVADDVQVVDVSAPYGLLGLLGPLAAGTLARWRPGLALPVKPLTSLRLEDPALGELYIISHPRADLAGYDLFVPVTALPVLWADLMGLVKASAGGPVGWQALEIARVESGLPRFGADLDENNLVPEAGIESQAVSYTKGCYVGQETVARLRARGQVSKALRGLVLPAALPALPAKGDRLLAGGREIGYLTSAVRSSTFGAVLGLGYVRREFWDVQDGIVLRTATGEHPARVVTLPFAGGTPALTAV